MDEKTQLLMSLTQCVDNSKITLTNTDDIPTGKKFKSRFIVPGIAGYPGQFGNVLITKESLDKFVKTLETRPVIIEHQVVTNENIKNIEVGRVHNVWFNEDDGWYWCDGVITDDKAVALINNGWSVSCSYNVVELDNKGGTENNIKYDVEFLNGIFTHLAIVNNPRYERANIVFNSKTIENFNPNQPRVPKGNSNGGQFAKQNSNKIIKPKLRDYNTFLNKHKAMGLIEKYPSDFLGQTDDDIANYLGIEGNKPAIFYTPLEIVKIYRNNIPHIKHETDKTRLLGLKRAIKTLQSPNIIIQDKKENYYIKFFNKNNEDKIHLQVIKTTKKGGFYKTNFQISKNKFEKIEGQVIYDLTCPAKESLNSSNSITDNSKFFKPLDENEIEKAFINGLLGILRNVTNAKDEKDIEFLSELNKILRNSKWNVEK